MTGNSNRYLIDTNVLSTAQNTYYSDDIVPTFWEKIDIPFRTGQIIILDKVKDEICFGDADNFLAQWIEEKCKNNTISL